MGVCGTTRVSMGVGHGCVCGTTRVSMGVGHGCVWYH